MYNGGIRRYLLFSIELLLIFLIIATPVFRGSIKVLPLTTLQSISLFLLFLFLFHNAVFAKKIYYPTYTYLLIILIFIAVLQLISFPDFLIKIISPKTFFLYREYSAYLNQAKTHCLSFYSLPVKIEALKFISFLTIFFVTINTVEKRKQFNRLFLVLIFLGLILSFYGIARKYLVLGQETAQSFSTFGNRNHYAGYMVMIAPIAICYAIYSENKFKRFIFGFIGVIISASIFLSLSRAGTLSLIFSLTLMSFLLVKEGKIDRIYWLIGLSVILALFLVSLAGFAPIRDRFILFWKGLFVRWDIVRDSLKIFQDFPLFGIGWGNFQYIFPIYQKNVTFPSYYEYLHNDHFQLLVEMGLVGAVSYFLFLFKVFREIFGKLKERQDPFVKGIVLGGWCGLLGVIFHSFFDFNFHIPAVSFLFWLLLGLLYKCVHTHFHHYDGRERF